MNNDDRKKLAEEKKRINAYQKKTLKALKAEPLVRVQFQNLEGPEQDKLPLEFTFENVKKYLLLHNGIYDLPKSVIKHLRQRCKVPVYKQYDQVEEAGELRPEPVDPSVRIAGYRQRFALIPVETDEVEAA